ncbi:MAG: transporter substrate-binding domain-containing protein [Candidatus Aminicenantes bacterium]|nr:transporter substrate-binding domain-containing protein [Candidatus Aminicenantes bacterium]
MNIGPAFLSKLPNLYSNFYTFIYIKRKPVYTQNSDTKERNMKFREYIFFAILLGVIALTVLVLQDREEGPSSQLDAPIAPNGNGPEDVSQSDQKHAAQQKDVSDELRQKLKFASGILEERKSDLPDMIKVKKVRVLTTYSFANYFVSEGQSYGYEYSHMEEFRKFLNKGKGRRDIKVDFYYIPIPYDMLIPALQRGYGDIVAANLTITPERSEEVDFTDPYLWGIKEVLITNKNAERIDKLEDLAGLEIFVREDSSYHFSLNKLNERLAAMDLKPVEIVTLPGLLNTGEIIEMVNAGAIEMTFADSHIASFADKLFPDIKVYDNIVLNDDVRFGWMIRKNNPQLKASLNDFIKTIKKGTLLGNIHFKRYFKENPWVRKALDRKDLNKFSDYAPLFKKYGEKYGIDWMLIAALSFQESRFNPNAKSRYGAVGLMQVLPSTAKDMGIPNIESPEDNIHAGVKYLDFVRNRYFSDDILPMDERVRFTLASYNAGPANIRRSRNTTEQMGYDSAIWFGNVEMGTMKQVGSEPVQYVRNINKYYLSFLISDVVAGVKEEYNQDKLNELKKKD